MFVCRSCGEPVHFPDGTTPRHVSDNSHVRFVCRRCGITLQDLRGRSDPQGEWFPCPVCGAFAELDHVAECTERRHR